MHVQLCMHITIHVWLYEEASRVDAHYGSVAEVRVVGSSHQLSELDFSVGVEYINTIQKHLHLLGSKLCMSRIST